MTSITPHSEAAVERVYAWNKHKQSFSPRQIHLAWDVLARKRWIEAGAARREARESLPV